MEEKLGMASLSVITVIAKTVVQSKRNKVKKIVLFGVVFSRVSFPGFEIFLETVMSITSSTEGNVYLLLSGMPPLKMVHTVFGLS